VRLQLHALAYNSGQFPTHPGNAGAQGLVDDEANRAGAALQLASAGSGGYAARCPQLLGPRSRIVPPSRATESPSGDAAPAEPARRAPPRSFCRGGYRWGPSRSPHLSHGPAAALSSSRWRVQQGVVAAAVRSGSYCSPVVANNTLGSHSDPRLVLFPRVDGYIVLLLGNPIGPTTVQASIPLSERLTSRRWKEPRAPTSHEPRPFEASSQSVV
jgi:hypothetical protein